MITKLQPSELRLTYDPESLQLPSPEDLTPTKPIIGQERAVSALQFGLGNKATGFNIFVAGMPGTGKQTAVMHYLENLAQKDPSPCDWVYVNNFQDPYFPKRLSLPKGLAHVLQQDIRHFLIQAQSTLIKIFESEEFTNKRDELFQEMQEEERNMFTELAEKAQQKGLVIQRTPLEVIALPMMNGKPISEKEFLALDDEEKEALVEKQRQFKDELRTAARRRRALEIELNKKLRELEQDTALRAIDVLLEELEEKYVQLPEVNTFLQEMKTDLLEHLREFIEFNSGKDKDHPPSPMKENSVPRRYEVNVLVDNKNLEGAPILLEINPTYTNLFGKIEKESVMGTLITDFTLIRSGSLHKANGGYLILPVEELLRNYLSWDSLKRALRTKNVDIEEPGERMGFLTSKSVKPEPIPLEVQVILIGRPIYYYLLLHYDEDFKELFKVKADFDNTMARNEENTRDFIQFLQNICQQEKLLPLDAGGMGKMLEYTHRLASDREKISTRFGEIVDLLREAYHYAQSEQAGKVGAAHMQKAIEQRKYRSGLIQEKMQEMIQQEEIFIDVEGAVAGQVNGLSYIGMGDTAFGRPTRITASVSVGQAGIVDLEREVQLGGPIHSKGVMILSGYLAEKFGHDKPISLSAQLTFEQSYSEIDGDSASSAELYALLSSLSGLPVKQGIAVSGSVNQKGQVQAVGGINEKIEGFFDICRLKGLTGEQGVLIPHSNRRHLMLKEEVVEAVRKGDFHIWAVQTIEEGIELLTGVPAGKLLPSTAAGEVHFEKDSVFENVNERLREIADILRKIKAPVVPKKRKSSWQKPISK